MFFDERQSRVHRILTDFVQSPSLRHIRDPKMLAKLAEDVVSSIDGRSRVWQKWDADREAMIRAVALCWVPEEDVLAFLNGLPGPRLTLTDVVQRLRAVHEEPYNTYPDERLRGGCVALYNREKASGTEFPAIVGALQEFVEQEEQRLREELQERWRAQRDAEKLALQRRFLSGADCKWTRLDGVEGVYTRINGRAYRLRGRPDRRVELERIEYPNGRCSLIGTYENRGAASRALNTIAFSTDLI